jgi:HEPN domain
MVGQSPRRPRGCQHCGRLLVRREQGRMLPRPAGGREGVKAVLVAYGIDFPRSHALERLIALMPAEPASTFDFEAVAELSPWAVAGRYPEDIPSPDLPTTRRLIHAAKTVLHNAATVVAGLGPHTTAAE